MFSDGSYLEQVKDISAQMWIDENSVPTVCAYGAWDRMQAFGASERLHQTLTLHCHSTDSILINGCRILRR